MGWHRAYGWCSPMKCPACGKPLGALTAKPHCPSKTCTWSDCNCGATVDRNVGTSFGGPVTT